MRKEASSCWNGKRPGILEMMLLCCGITATLLAGCAPRKQVPAGQEVETGGKVETPADTITAAKVNPWVPYVPKGYHAISGTNQFFYKNDTVRSKDSTIVFTVNPDLDTGPVEEYVGNLNGLHVFSNDRQVFFSDGRQADFSPFVTSIAIDKAGMKITCRIGCEEITTSLAKLHDCLKRGATRPAFYRRYIPKSNREMSLGPIIIFHAYSDDVPEAVCHFISSLYVHYFSDEPVPTSEASDFAGVADYYGNLWKNILEGWSDFSSLIGLDCQQGLQKVAENERYLTLYYTDWGYVGGIHPNYHSFYITYDKELQKTLTLSDIIEASKLAKLRKAAFTALDNMKKAQWEKGLSYYDGAGYSCCGKSGANVTDQADIDATNMVLQHAALLPQGIVLSYHPYQIGSFAAGEFHALLPYSEIGDCLKIDYKGLTADDMDASRLFKLD